MLPYRAQGAAMAIEDGCVLGNLFSRVNSTEDVPYFLRAYEALRLARTANTQAQSRLNQKIFHYADGPEQEERDASMRAAMAGKTEGSANQWADKGKNKIQFSYDADAAAEEWWREVGSKEQAYKKATSTDENSSSKRQPGPHDNPTSNSNIDDSANQQAKAPEPSFAEGPRPEYDDYGKELDKEARIWKTYVKEASRWDSDMVEGWNKFVIESLKSLQPDPAENSAKTLSEISRFLVLIASNQPGSSLNLTEHQPPEFVAPVSAICVNTLWLLSPSLSVAVTLIAMLAKDWARGYIAELTGQPYQQARKRQRRWDGLKEWRVPEVIMFLPSLLHLALSYGASTILPLLHEHCPYSTPVSKVIQMLPKPTFPYQFIRWMRPQVPDMPQFGSWDQTQDEDLMDELTSRVLSWLVVHYEDTKSADITLQAVAGASAKLPLLPLFGCGAYVLLEQRLQNCLYTRQATGKRYLKDRLLEDASLYGRAFTTPGSFHESSTFWLLANIPQCIRDVEDEIIVSTSSPNKVAFALAGLAIRNSTLALKPGFYIVLTTRLLQLHLKDQVTLEAPALSSLLRAATCWPSIYKAEDVSLTDYVRLMMALVRFLSTLDRWRRSQMHGLVGTALTAFACSHRDYSAWPMFNDSEEWNRRAQARSMAMEYERSPPSTDTQVTSLITFGLLELLKYHADSLDDDDLEAFVKTLHHYLLRPATIDIFGFPKRAFGEDYQYMTETLVPFLKPDNQGIYAWNEDRRAVCLAAFNTPFLDNSLQAVGIYALALENLRSARSGLLKQSFCALLSFADWPFRGQTFVSKLDGQNVLPLCLELLDSEDERVVPYIMVGLRELIVHILYEQDGSLVDKANILQPLLSHEPFLNAAQRSEGSYILTVDTLFMACGEAWLPRLEDMTGRVSQHIKASGIVENFLVADPHDEYYHRVYEKYLVLDTQLKRQDNSPPDWV
ncbi:hypothetical protein FRC07_004886 [Ceratobasidium sp. 392]|nr:hypothetical protein FRC07_004886 [Ceratobasidium sp. 392]